jgi:hypothetical protein
MSSTAFSLSGRVRVLLGSLMAFAFSRAPLEKLLRERFQGHWKLLPEMLLDFPEAAAERRCREFALSLRLLDEEQDVSKYARESGAAPFGSYLLPSKKRKNLSLREACNKIIHAKRIAWDFSDPERPVIVCESQQPEQWTSASIDLVKVAAFCGNLMS